MTIKERNDIKYILLKERIKTLSKELNKEIKNTDPASIYSTILISKHSIILELSCYIEDLEQNYNVLLKNEYEVVKPKKKLGDMKCGEMSCNECPFISFDCSNVLKSIPKATLYEVLEGFMTIYNFEKIREELDKDVEE